MFNFVEFYYSLVSQFGENYANCYFDNWYRFWLSCGDELKNMSYDRYRILHNKTLGYE